MINPLPTKRRLRLHVLVAAVVALCSGAWLHAAAPDLVVDNLGLSVAQAKPLTQITVRFRVRNLGTADHSRSTAEILISRQTDAPLEDDPVLERFEVSYLSPGMTSDLIKTVTIPGSFLPGSAQIWVALDVDGTGGQANTANDLAHVPFTVLQPPACDLVPSTLSLTASSARPGTQLIAGYSIANQGSGLHQQSTANLLWVPASGKLSEARVIAAFATGVIESGQSQSYRYAFTLPADLDAGACTLRLQANADGAATETSTANNTSTAAFTVLEPIPADLIPTQLAVSKTSVAPGKTVTLTFRALNQGAGVATASTGRVALGASADAPGEDDVTLQEFAVSQLAAGAYQQLSLTLTIPNTTAPADAHLWVLLDTARAVVQSDWSNDQATTPITIATPVCDLKPTGLTLTSPADPSNPGNLPAGSLVSYNLQFANAGAEVHQGSTARLQIISNPGLPTASVWTLATLPVGLLAPGDSTALSGTLTLPAALPVGTARLSLQADYLGVLTQSSTANDTLLADAPIVASTDLVIASFAASPTQLLPGGDVQVNVTIRNQGVGTHNQSTGRYDLLVPGSASTTTVHLLSFNLGTLAAGASVSLSHTLPIPDTVSPATCQLLLTLDVNATGGQSDRTNDTAQSTIELLTAPPCDLLPTTLSAAPADSSVSSIKALDQIRVKFQIRNQGVGRCNSSVAQIRLSTSLTAPQTDDDILGTVDVGVLGAASESATIPSVQSFESTVQIPLDVPAGTRYLWVVADPDQEVVQSDRTNDAIYIPLTISPPTSCDIALSSLTISPVNVAPDSWFTLSFTVTNNGPGPHQGSTAEITLSTNASQHAADDVLMLSFAVEPLASGASQRFTYDLYIPGYYDPGTRYLRADLDVDLETSQTNTANDHAQASLVILDTQVARQNLIYDLRVIDYAYDGETERSSATGYLVVNWRAHRAQAIIKWEGSRANESVIWTLDDVWVSVAGNTTDQREFSHSQWGKASVLLLSDRFNGDLSSTSIHIGDGFEEPVVRRFDGVGYRFGKEPVIGISDTGPWYLRRRSLARVDLDLSREYFGYQLSFDGVVSRLIQSSGIGTLETYAPAGSALDAADSVSSAIATADGTPALATASTGPATIGPSGISTASIKGLLSVYYLLARTEDRTADSTERLMKRGYLIVDRISSQTWVVNYWHQYVDGVPTRYYSVEYWGATGTSDAMWLKSTADVTGELQWEGFLAYSAEQQLTRLLTDTSVAAVQLNSSVTLSVARWFSGESWAYDVVAGDQALHLSRYRAYLRESDSRDFNDRGLSVAEAIQELIDRFPADTIAAPGSL